MKLANMIIDSVSVSSDGRVLRVLDICERVGVGAIQVFRILPWQQAFFLVFAALVAFHPRRLVSQEYTRTEVGVTSSSILETRFSSAADSGVGARFTYNITSGLGIDSEIDSYLTNTHASPALQFGGRATLAVLGPKAGIRRQGYGVFFKVRPGLLSFGSAVAGSSLFGNPASKRITHAVLDLGFISEFYPSSRTILRADLGTLLTRYGDATLFSVPTTNGAFTIRSTGIVSAPWHIALGAGYRLGNLRGDKEHASQPPKLEMGVQYSLLTLERSATTVRDESGIGSWGAWHFSRYFGLDSSVNFFPRQVRFADFQQGGRILQVLAGLRSGVQRGRVGVFVKFRPGLQLYTDTAQNETGPGLTHFSDVAFDLGGIIEVFISRHTLFRFDAGDTIVQYRARRIIAPDGTPLHIAGFTNAAIQLTSGFGFRF